MGWLSGCEYVLTVCAGTLLGHAPSSKMKAIYEKFLASYADR